MKCLDPPPEWLTLAKSLEKAKQLGPGGVDRLKKLMELAVKSKATSKTYPDDKWVQEAILRIIRAFNSVLSTVRITTPDQEIESAFGSAVMAAVNCLDVADLLLALIEYMAGDKEEGIPALSAEGRKKLTALLIELYALKQKPGVELEEIHRKGQEIRSLLWKEREQATTERRKKKGLPTVDDFLIQADFSSLEGQITLAEEFREGLNSLECYDSEGKLLCTVCSLLDIKSESGFFTVTLAQEPAIGKLSFPCHGGRLELTRVATGAVASELGVIRGWAHVYGGNFLGTLRLPEGTPWRVGEGSVRFGGQEARLIGVRQGELLLSASDLPLPLDGTLPVEVEGPEGLQLTGELPAWSYVVECPRVTARRQATRVPVRAFLYGLPPSALVTIRFFPREGQRITPLEVQLPASQLLTGLEVALFTTSKLGEQHFGVAVGFELTVDAH